MNKASEDTKVCLKMGNVILGVKASGQLGLAWLMSWASTPDLDHELMQFSVTGLAAESVTQPFEAGMPW